MKVLEVSAKLMEISSTSVCEALAEAPISPTQEELEAYCALALLEKAVSCVVVDILCGLAYPGTSPLPPTGP